jgi:hypothetical protein
MSLSSTLEDSDALISRVNALNLDDSRACLSWLCVHDSGADADTEILHTRLRGYLQGPARRHRAGWLQLALDCVVDGQEDDCAVDGVDLLFDLRELLDSTGLFPSAPPVNLLKDINRDVLEGEGESDDTVKFSLPEGYRWFSVADAQGFLGISNDDVSDLKSEIKALKEASASSISMSSDSKSALVADIRADLALDMSEERWASGLGSSVAIQRRTLAFEFDKDAFFLYDFRLHDSGRHRDLVSGEVTQDFIRDNLFNSQITPADIKKMERRSLVPEQFWTQAYTRDSDKTIVLGGEQGSAFKSDESLRIQQQALLKKCQHIVHVLAACSRAHKQLESVLFSAGPGGTMPIEHATQLGFTYATKDVYLIDEVELIDIPGANVLSIQQLGDIRLSRSSLEESLFAASDSFHIFAAEMSEIERQRDELYVRARSGNPDFKIPRPTSDPTKFVKPMDKLDKLADAECVRQKNLLALKKGKQDFRKPRGQDTRTPPRKGNRGGSQGQDRRAQSKRDKERSNKNKTDKDKSVKPQVRTPHTPENREKKPFVKK